MLYILYPLKCIPGHCDVKMDRNKKTQLLKKNTRDFYMTVYFKHKNLEIKIKYADIPFSSIFLSKKEEYYHHAQVDFDFGQVHIVWWLSYCQVEEKINVEDIHELILSVLSH